jgi:hypothetical protein
MMTPRSDMSIRIETNMSRADFRAILQDIVQYAIEDLPFMSERLHDAIERAKVALAQGVQ